MRPRYPLALMSSVLLLSGGAHSWASDHLDSPTVIADPRTDIGDVYAWTSPDHRQLNLVMTIVGHSFSDKVAYVFHVDSGKQFGRTTVTTDVTCRFASATQADCQIGKDADRAQGDASVPTGLQGAKHRFRVFAGLRDDPFFNNVKGTRAAYTVAAKALQGQTASCPHFDAQTSKAILDQWRHTDGGPGTNFLAGWTPAAIVVSVDLGLVNRGGPMLAVWGATLGPTRQIDREGRPLTGNALLGLFASEAVSNALKEEYNAATPQTAARFIPEIQKALGKYDAFDGHCGNALLTRHDPQYREMATLLADDRLWVNSASGVCTQLFGVELSMLAGYEDLLDDCGGRTPNYDSVNVYRSLLVDGTFAGVDDGIHEDDRVHSTTQFPFLAAPK
ncbi:MAG: DUF4331 family protein [Proteobacteria bacterium]|nr:DUF4331 family protein [Pseudomonadota bacterium]